MQLSGTGTSSPSGVFRFLLTELDAGLALLDVADTSQSGETIRHLRQELGARLGR